MNSNSRVQSTVSQSLELKMKNPASTNFTWKVDNFSKLTQNGLYSYIFIAERCRWRLLVYLKVGYGYDDHLSIHIFAEPNKLPNGWSRDADISLSVINQLDNRPI
ncbi:MATH domain and coiled-coil domain-containing protein At3g58250-like [Mercurialis annua]|uniref:MATH domain and coiled-coil domain-containing protein At3g58250-like n=1 Tax=Mercurialis annua TaxID=3986 RepID=UPI00215FF78F|nr:MATH domain and coiled-coil domain-containing protein At3g58250-like [Mercurialis annua]